MRWWNIGDRLSVIDCRHGFFQILVVFAQQVDLFLHFDDDLVESFNGIVLIFEFFFQSLQSLFEVLHVFHKITVNVGKMFVPNSHCSNIAHFSYVCYEGVGVNGKLNSDGMFWYGQESSSAQENDGIIAGREKAIKKKTVVSVSFGEMYIWQLLRKKS